MNIIKKTILASLFSILCCNLTILANGPAPDIDKKTKAELTIALEAQNYDTIINGMLPNIAPHLHVPFFREMAEQGHIIGVYLLLKHLSGSKFCNGADDQIAQGLAYVIIIEILTKMALCCRDSEVTQSDCEDTWKAILKTKCNQYFYEVYCEFAGLYIKDMLFASVYAKALQKVENYFKKTLEGKFEGLPHSVWVNKVVWSSSLPGAWGITWGNPAKPDYAVFLDNKKGKEAKEEILQLRDAIYERVYAKHAAKHQEQEVDEKTWAKVNK